MTKRVVECNICGEPLAAATDEELSRQVSDHLETEHEDADRDEEGVRKMVAAEAYDAGDA
jgi:predicted small metal-binding protein